MSGSRWGQTKIESHMPEAVALAIFEARVDISAGRGKRGQPGFVAPDEDVLLAAIIELAQWYGWKVIHIRPARTANGWRTPVQGDGVGFPDLFALRRATRHRFAAELKVGASDPSADQDQWLEEMECCGIPAYTWWPSSLQEIKDVLKHGAEWPAGFRRKQKAGNDHAGLA